MTILIPDKLRDLKSEHATLLQDIVIETKDLALAEDRPNKDSDQRRAIAMKERDLAALESRVQRLQGKINAVVTELNTPQAKATRQKHRDSLKALADTAGAQQVKRAAKIDSAIEALIDMFKDRSAAGAKAYAAFTGAVDGLTDGSIGLYESAHGMILPRLIDCLLNNAIMVAPAVTEHWHGATNGICRAGRSAPSSSAAIAG